MSNFVIPLVQCAPLMPGVRRLRRGEDEDKKPHGAGERTVATSKPIAPCSTLRAGQYSSFLRKVIKRKRRVTSGVPPNKRLHLTANSVVFMRKASVVSRLNARQVKRGVRLRVESSERCVVVNDRVPLLPRLNGGEAKVVLLHLAWYISHWACRRSLARPICRKLKADEPQPGS